jgi:hypothetical protein
MQTSLHALFSMPPRNFSAPPSRRSGMWSERVALAESDNIRRFLAKDQGRNGHDASALSYRHDWGDVDANATLFLEWDSIGPTSQIFVSIAEGSADGSRYGEEPGMTKCSLSEVAQKDGGIGIRVNVEGRRPVRLYANYLVINA